MSASLTAILNRRRSRREDVGLLQRRRQASLPLESFGGDRGRQLRREDLDDDLPAEAVFARYEYAGPSSAAKLTLDGVRTAERFLDALSKIHWH